MSVRCLELFSGIGGFAVVASRLCWQVAAAFDINQLAAKVYRLNFQHDHHVRAIESIRATDLAGYQADFWWMSPPCQPFTRRGVQKDQSDNRNASFLHVLDLIQELGPRMLAIENVPEFADSNTADLLRDTLSSAGYQWKEFEFCPSMFHIPNRRRRFYLAAAQHAELVPVEMPVVAKPLSEFVEEPFSDELFADDIGVEYSSAIDVVSGSDPWAITSCFTSAYGSSPVQSGSYLRVGDRIRRFSPREMLNMLGFPGTFRLANALTRRQSWKLVGNSLSIPAVEYVLRSFALDDANAGESRGGQDRPMTPQESIALCGRARPTLPPGPQGE